MNTCLQKKLQKVIANDELDIIGGFSVKVNNAESNFFAVQYLDETMQDNISLEGSLTADWTYPNYPSFSGSGKIRVNDKENITLINFESDCFEMLFSALDYSPLKSIYGYMNFQDLTTLSQLLIHNSLENVSLKNFALMGEITDLLPLKESLLTIDFRGTQITGLMSEIGAFPKLTNIGLLPDGVSGSIESFVAARRALGQNTGSVVIVYGVGCINITFNGNALTGTGNEAFSWTATTITYNGVTINA